MINKDKSFFQYNTGDIVYIISLLTSQLCTTSRKVMIKYIGQVVIYKIIDPHNYLCMMLDGKILRGLFEHERLKPANMLPNKSVCIICMLCVSYGTYEVCSLCILYHFWTDNFSFILSSFMYKFSPPWNKYTDSIVFPCLCACLLLCLLICQVWSQWISCQFNLHFV